MDVQPEMQEGSGTTATMAERFIMHARERVGHLEFVHYVHGAGALIDIGPHANIDKIPYLLSALLAHPGTFATCAQRR